MKNYHTPHWWICLKLWIWILPFTIWPMLAWGGAAFLGSLIGVFGFMYFNSLVMRCWNFVIGSRRDPRYVEWRRGGGDPYFDFLPWPANTDCWAVRQGGRPEPFYTTFVPPQNDDWLCQCLHCGARNRQGVDTNCWNCQALLPGVSQVQVPSGCRKIKCYYCWMDFAETNPGDLERGVICPYCQTVNYPVAQ